MRIDFNQGPQQLPESDGSVQSPATNGSTTPSITQGQGQVQGEDQARLSGAHVEVAALAAQASQLPGVREERVQALRVAVESRRYHTTAGQVAGAMVDSMITQRAA
jgi:flagellar biosynthesis anti-sigma factor FlgM